MLKLWFFSMIFFFGRSLPFLVLSKGSMRFCK